MNIHKAAVTPSPLTGVALKIVSVTFFVGMSTAIKAAGPLPNVFVTPRSWMMVSLIRAPPAGR